MGFKRVRDSSINEIVLAAYVPDLGKSRWNAFRIHARCIQDILLSPLIVFTFARVFVNQEDAFIYEIAFRRLFDRISCVLETEVKWHMFHTTGFRTIVTDMDLGQLKGEYITNMSRIRSEYILIFVGFSLYLRSVDPVDRQEDWTWYAQRINIFCQVHFCRKIKEIEQPGAIYHSMEELLRCTSKKDYDDLITCLIGISYIPNLLRIHS